MAIGLLAGKDLEETVRVGALKKNRYRELKGQYLLQFTV